MCSISENESALEEKKWEGGDRDSKLHLYLCLLVIQQCGQRKPTEKGTAV